MTRSFLLAAANEVSQQIKPMTVDPVNVETSLTPRTSFEPIMSIIPLSVNEPSTSKSSKLDQSRDTMYYTPLNIRPFPKIELFNK